MVIRCERDKCPRIYKVPERAVCGGWLVVPSGSNSPANRSSGTPRRGRAAFKGHAQGADCTGRRLYLFRPSCRHSICESSGKRTDRHARRVDRSRTLRSFEWIAAPRVDAFETPLGRVPVDTETCSQIGRFEFVTQTDAPHEPEHALEVELPFLQSVLSSFQLVPLVVGDAAPQEVAHLLRQLWDGPEALIVVSSDLSHYHSYETAQRLDSSTAEAIEQGEWVSLGASRACGWVAVAGLLIETRRRGLGGYRLALCNSGDTAGSRDRVVGYGAWMFGEAG